MQSPQIQTAPGKTRQLPFTTTLLENQLRRHYGDELLTANNVQVYEIRYQRSSTYTLFGLIVDIKSQKLNFNRINLLVKQALKARRPSTHIGWREQALYANLMDFMPIKSPPLVAADSAGNWLIIEIDPNGRFVDTWRKPDYFLSIDLLASLHELFWGLNEDLQNFSFLGRPLDSESSLILQSAQRGLNRLRQSSDSILSQDETLLNSLDLLTKQSNVLVTSLKSLPATLIHGDYWPGNLIIYPASNIYAIDWQNSAIGPGILDLVTFIQECLWWFNPLPFAPSDLITRYRSHLHNQRGLSWSDAEWNLYWDHALLWTFLVDWLEPLSLASNATLDQHYNDLQRVWLKPVQEICNLRLK